MSKSPRKSSSRGYPVGYGKPPREHQFKAGKSGNAKGRPAGSLSIATVLARALRERVEVTENGRRRSFTKLEIATKQIVNKAASGDPGSIRFLIDLVRTIEAQFEPKDSPADLPEDDRKVLEGFLARMQPLGKKGDSNENA